MRPTVNHTPSLFMIAIFLSSSVLLILPGCALPSSSKTLVTVSGQLLSPKGHPMSGNPIELTLPPDYGLNEIDLEHGAPEDHSSESQRVKIVTDALGSFSYTFKPISYSQAMWILPPLGSLPRKAPPPHFYLRLPQNQNQEYSILVKENETVYEVYMIQGAAAGKKVSHSSAKISGKLIEDKRGDMESWIADIRLKLNPESLSPKSDMIHLK